MMATQTEISAGNPDDAGLCDLKPARRLGVVQYVNTLPLIDGLEQIAGLHMRPAVPSTLIGMLLANEVDMALCSIVDYQQTDAPLRIVPSGLLGCNGSTMTVRLFSRVPAERLTQVHCDLDSHTSVMLLRVLLKECHGVTPEFVDYDAAHHLASGTPVDWPEAMLLIGDKVVTNATPAIRYPYQLDLGAEWKELTGLPFVFATWMCRADRDVTGLAAALDRQRRHNIERLDWIVAHRVAQHGWPLDLAKLYLRDMLCYEWTEDTRAGVERFFEMAHSMGLLKQHRPLEFHPL